MYRTASLFVLGSFVVACSAKTTHFPRPGESLRADAFTIEPGGKGFNLAVGAHRLGAKVDGIFAIGEDLFAQLASEAFVQAGLDRAMLRRVAAPTGGGIGFTNVQGENCLAVYPGANLALSSDDVRAVASSILGADLVLAQFEVADEPILEAFTLARGAGRRTLLNPSPYRALDPGLLRATSILVLNRVEAGQAARGLGLSEAQESPEDLDQLASALLDSGPDLVVVTQGADGATAYERGKPPHHQPAFPITSVDPLGAGDAFTAALATGLQNGCPLADALLRATACGALVCQRIGVFHALPTEAELDRFLQGRGGSVLA